MSFQTPVVSGLKIKDEGVTIANPAQSLDFVGAGVGATVSGGDVTATIPGGSAITEVRNETPTGTPNGILTTFTIAHSPVAGTVAVYVNGARQKLATDYTFSGTTITFIVAPDTGSLITADYQY